MLFYLIKKFTLSTLLMIHDNIFSILSIFIEYVLHIRIKRSKKSADILIPEHRKIADYLEMNKIKYIYKPKYEKEYDFELPEYDAYIKYWGENSLKSERDKLMKKSKKYEIKYIDIYYNKINSMKTLHGSFMKKLSRLTKKR